jgi:hypothetical protein
LLSREKKDNFSFHFFHNLPIGILEGIRKGKPEEATSGFQRELRKQQSEAQTGSYFYHGFWLFARSEAILFCFWSRFVAAGAV